MFTHPSPYTPSTDKWPGNAFDEIKAIEIRARNIARLAGAASTLHNEGLATELFTIADDLNAAAGSMRNIVGDCTARELGSAQQSTVNMLGAMLALHEVKKVE